MSCQKLILITDNVNKKQSIYTNNCDSDHSFIQCIEWLQKGYLENQTIKYIVTDDDCEIFKEINVVKPGWVWSSNDVQKVSLYKLSWISVECPKIVEQRSTGTQTETQTTIRLDKTTMTTMTNDINYFAIEDSLESCGSIECTEPLVKNFKRLSINNFDLGTGYANHSFSPLWNSIQSEFQSELRERLSCDNLGLRSSTHKIKLE